MKRLAIVAHAPSPDTRKLRQATEHGARHVMLTRRYRWEIVRRMNRKCFPSCHANLAMADDNPIAYK